MKFLPLAFSLTLVYVAMFAMPDSALDRQNALRVEEVQDIPRIDGKGDDVCWRSISWQPLDQVWLPWGEQVDSADFYGRFKVAWSSQANLLYVLLEVNDDVVSDAYTPGKSSEMYNFDMFEVFIDEDRSGGLHVFDGGGTVDSVFGINAENAFGYHICTKFPDGEYAEPVFIFEDITGNTWGNVVRKDYRSHFPEFVCKRTGNVSRWEFSLMVFSDEYDENEFLESRIALIEGKIMGLSLAYNDNDKPDADPSNALRDNFFGSVATTEEGWNDHWKNADSFAPVMLVKPSGCE
ncbi:MAG: hypothetical protein JW801_02690 [Bacteroidales bacterium]|nr:hypothetical protein [Bacteroidales bacterium]